MYSQRLYLKWHSIREAQGWCSNLAWQKWGCCHPQVCGTERECCSFSLLGKSSILCRGHSQLEYTLLGGSLYSSSQNHWNFPFTELNWKPEYFDVICKLAAWEQRPRWRREERSFGEQMGVIWNNDTAFSSLYSPES